MSVFLVYLCRNTKNAKTYVGITRRSLRRRIAEHLSSARTLGLRGHAFHRALHRYGKDAFRWEVLEESVPEEEVDEREIFFIRQYGSYGRAGYNLTRGGRLARNSLANPFDEPEIRASCSTS